MSSSLQFLVAGLLVYVAVDVIAVLGLNLQFGVTGILNFGFIMFQAAGAYVYALCTLGPAGPSSGYGAGFQTYVWGTHLPFPLPFLAGTAAGGVVAWIVGLVVLRRLRGDYQAVALLVMSLIALAIVTNQVGLLDGANGLSGVPQPLFSRLGSSGELYAWYYVVFAAVLTAGSWWFVRRVTASPLGRLLRGIRENDEAAQALGKDVLKKRMLAFVVGGTLAGLSGALLVASIGAWAPASWGYAETFVYITALVVGGYGSELGVIVGVLVVPILLGEVLTFLPVIGPTSWIEAAELMAYGVIALVFLWFRPEGIVPEPRVRYRNSRSGSSESAA